MKEISVVVTDSMNLYKVHVTVGEHILYMTREEAETVTGLLTIALQDIDKEK